MSAPLTPLNLAPANDATVTTSNFMASATLRPWPNRTKLQFQFATDVAFSTDVHTAETDFRNPGSIAVFAGTPRLPQGSVWVRVRAIEEGTGDPSSWSASHELTVQHPGNALLVNPGRGQAVPWSSGGLVDFYWEFRDNCEFDSQTAFQLVVQTDDSDSTYALLAEIYDTYSSIASVNDDYDDLANSGGSATLYDSGKVTSTDQTLTVDLPAGAQNEVVRWGVRTWDDDDETAGYTQYVPFFVGDLPSVTITAPTTTIDTPTPTITWTYSSPAGHAQQGFRVRFYNTDDGVLLFDSGPQVGAGTTYTPPSGGFLVNGLEFTLVLTVTTSIGMELDSEVDLTASWTAPPNPSFEIDPQWYAEFGQVDILWPGAPQDPTFVAWKVYRRDDAGWELLGETTEDFFSDHSAPPKGKIQYAVTQVGVAFGVQVESTPFPIEVDLTVTTYMIKVLEDPGRVIVLRNVTGDEFAHQYEANVMDVIGAGRKAEIGTTLGRAGSLTVQLRDMGVDGGAGEAYRTLLDIKESKVACLLRVPFRETIVVHLGDIGVSRIAGVVSELSDVTIPYTEIV